MTQERRQKKLHVLSLRVDDTTLQELQEAADEENRPVSNLIATILRQWQMERRAKKKAAEAP
jgi:predicted transcriptional regulator